MLVKNTEAAAATLAQAAEQRQEPAWLVDQRVAALAAFSRSRFLRVQRFDYRDWNLFATPTLAYPVATTQTTVGAGSFVQRGTTVIQCELPQDLQDQGVILTDILTAIRTYPELVQPYLMQVIGAETNQLASYHLAYLNAGFFLYVPENVVISDPLTLQLIQDATQPTGLQTHGLIVAGENSQVALTQHLTTQGDLPGTVNQVVEIVAQENSQVTFAAVDELGAQTQVAFQRRANVAANAQVNWAIGLMNQGNTVGQCETDLIGDGAQSDAKVVAITNHDQREGINTKITNHGKHTVGNILQRGVLQGQSELIFNGIGDIIHGAAGAQAEQENRILMMDPGTHGDANPILLIDENDVLAGHAASVGQVDQRELYYLLSRGLDKQTAERLVIRGFLSAVLTAIPSLTVRQQLVQTIERNLRHD
ncbi:Fe-S cluster assembly protein SufD [Levilactobacillus namurensis]|uniref:Fe-S cluster assembly protein SufD n=1 Tax=Levilactobacillus namurensis TaxID=380393 RepID=UPI00222F9BDB|nr:Fe-S cluster assembly protein SufD [Levilactobacillus namurensis]MCW3778886.1 Fe-S cluster assembly protein SufD [Levilactobacillus namurensis]MDT7017819.1 Fe-S cluster assembly protein SufD [Levilactobacillus namurensis]WNN65181.1 Fe-S cluster assembly protein SufD [Levilactobacillus namurensis]